MNAPVSQSTAAPRRLASALFATVAAAAVTLTVPAQAADMPVLDNESGTRVETSWDGPTTHLSWDGQTYTSEEIGFVGSRIFSPGDKVERTVIVSNTGTENAAVTLDIHVEQENAEQSNNPRLAESVFLGWKTPQDQDLRSFADLLGQDTDQRLIDMQLQPGSSTELTISVTMPQSATDHARAGKPSTVLKFDALLRVQEEQQSGVAIPAIIPPQLATTGARVASIGVIAAIMLGAGVLIQVKRRARLAAQSSPEGR